MTRLTKPQRARLEKLAAYLEGLPEDYRHFRMLAYVSSPVSAEAEAQYARRNGGVANCGTAACAAGHGPAAGILVPPRMFRPNKTVDWDAYTELFVGGADYMLYGFLFSAAWETVDNHHWGAAARIRYLLANGLPNQNLAFREQVALYAPYRIDAKARAEGIAGTQPESGK